VTGRWRLNFDGGSRGNPGPAAYGFVLVDADGNEAARVGEVLGRTTNNVAEYTGLVRGLEHALELGVRELAVRGDSELIVKQLRGEYRVKNETLKPLYEQARALLDRFDSTDVAHVYRADNSIADSLVNEALDAAASR
jgi:ribonuclease HI